MVCTTRIILLDNFFQILQIYILGCILSMQGTKIAAHQEALKREIERLREVYQQQNKLKKVTGTDNDSDSLQIQFEKEHVNLAA